MAQFVETAKVKFHVPWFLRYLSSTQAEKAVHLQYSTVTAAFETHHPSRITAAAGQPKAITRSRPRVPPKRPDNQSPRLTFGSGCTHSLTGLFNPFTRRNVTPSANSSL